MTFPPPESATDRPPAPPDAPGCGTVLIRAAACKTASHVQECATSPAHTTLIKRLEPLVRCAVTSSCRMPPDTGPGGVPGACGNGKCDSGETHLTCPKDCGISASANDQRRVRQRLADHAPVEIDARQTDKPPRAYAAAWLGSGSSLLSNGCATTTWPSSPDGARPSDATG